MPRTDCDVIADAGITRLIDLHAESLAPFLEWDPALAAGALDVLDDEVDAFLAGTNNREATQIGHEIARVLLRAVLTMRASAVAVDPVVKRAS